MGCVWALLLSCWPWTDRALREIKSPACLVGVRATKSHCRVHVLPEPSRLGGMDWGSRPDGVAQRGAPCGHATVPLKTRGIRDRRRWRAGGTCPGSAHPSLSSPVAAHSTSPCLPLLERLQASPHGSWPDIQGPHGDLALLATSPHPTDLPQLATHWFSGWGLWMDPQISEESL